MESEKIHFLKTITAFKNLALSKLKVVIDQFKPLTKIRGSYLFKEGDIVQNLYLVQTGEFKLLKKVFQEQEEFVSKADVIFKDPLKASKQNSQAKTKGPIS